MTEQTTTQYAVFHSMMEGIHRGPFDTRAEAEAWVREAEEDGFPKGLLRVRERTVSPWRD